MRGCAGRPFATDANKFALFGAAACELLGAARLGSFDAIHLHDWHAAFAALLIRFDPRFAMLAGNRLVFTIHNLALQGIRPFVDDESSLADWFPGLSCDRDAIADPRYPDCVNPMRAAINLCDKVHAVSPNYAAEIRKSNRAEIGFHGGEGLERDLQRAHRAGKLRGILNGCEYPPARGAPSATKFIEAARRSVIRWIGESEQVDSGHFIALERLARWRGKAPTNWITSISRLTPQKTALFQTTMENGESCLENILGALPKDHALVMLGSGDAEIERFLTSCAADCENFLFLRGYSEDLSQMIYALGDLFLMPSSFEPCGIGQMLAMRAGQPCLAHRVGGLSDTIKDNVDGFLFAGQDPPRQAARLRRKTQASARAQTPRAEKLVQNPPRRRRAPLPLARRRPSVLRSTIRRRQRSMKATHSI